MPANGHEKLFGWCLGGGVAGFLTYNRSSYLLDIYAVGDKRELLKLRSPFVQRLMQMTVIGGNSNQACNAPEPRVFESG